MRSLPRLFALGLACVLAAFGGTLAAQDYPNRPIRLVVGFPPGGPTDLYARLVAGFLSERFRQPVVVENKPGAGSNIAAEQVVKSPPDGYTLLVCASANTINTTLYAGKLGFDFAADTVPVAGLASVPNVLVVHPSVPANTVAEFIAYAKARQGKINMASSGSGTTPHLTGELFKTMTGVDLLHVPYRGSAPAVTGLVSGQVQAMFSDVTAAIAQIRAGALRPLGVTTRERSAVLPDVPPIAETVPGYEGFPWFGFVAPKGTPAPIVVRLNNEINAALADPKIRARLADIGATPLVFTPAEFGAFIRAETRKWAKVVTSSGAKVE